MPTAGPATAGAPSRTLRDGPDDLHALGAVGVAGRVSTGTATATSASAAPPRRSSRSWCSSWSAKAGCRSTRQSSAGCREWCRATTTATTAARSPCGSCCSTRPCSRQALVGSTRTPTTRSLAWSSEQSRAAQVRSKILRPLGLRDTSFPQAGRSCPGLFTPVPARTGVDQVNPLCDALPARQRPPRGLATGRNRFPKGWRQWSIARWTCRRGCH